MSVILPFSSVLPHWAIALIAFLKATVPTFLVAYQVTRVDCQSALGALHVLCCRCCCPVRSKELLPNSPFHSVHIAFPTFFTSPTSSTSAGSGTHPNGCAVMMWMLVLLLAIDYKRRPFKPANQNWESGGPDQTFPRKFPVSHKIRMLCDAWGGSMHISHI